MSLTVLALVVVAGTALVLDFVARDPSRREPPAATSQPPPTADDRRAAAPELPSLGAVRVESTQDGLTIRANDARRSAVLAALARAGGFAVEGEAGEDPPLKLVLKVADLRTALVAILGNAEHDLQYAWPDDGGDAVLTRVVLGPASERVDAGVAPGRPPLGAPDPSLATGDAGEVADLAATAERLRLTPEGRDRVRRKRERLIEGQRQEDLATLAEGSDDDRAGAASRLDADDADSFRALSKSVRGDPSSRVRMRAARRLGFGEASKVLPVLTETLADPDPDVVVEAVEALAFVGEAEAIPSLEGLEGHDDPAVRAAAEDALEVLR